jgi:CRP/FNR family cyclic AMP-dependent transcriptional regulator
MSSSSGSSKLLKTYNYCSPGVVITYGYSNVNHRQIAVSDIELSHLNHKRPSLQKHVVLAGAGNNDTRLKFNDRRSSDFATNLLESVHNSAIGRPIETIRNRCLFTQGETNEVVYALQTGRVKLSSILSDGKQVIVTICNPGDLVGEECLVGCTNRRTTATAMESGCCYVIYRVSMLKALHENPILLDHFIKHTLGSILRLQDDVTSDRSQPAKAPSARVLLHLAGSERANPEGLLPKISYEELAEMVGTTRPRVTQFLVKMKETGYIVSQGPMRVDRKRLCLLID